MRKYTASSAHNYSLYDNCILILSEFPQQN